MFSFSKKIALCLLLLTACIAVHANDIYTLDSIEAVWYDNTRIAHERLDSLGRREKPAGGRISSKAIGKSPRECSTSTKTKQERLLLTFTMPTNTR